MGSMGVMWMGSTGTGLVAMVLVSATLSGFIVVSHKAGFNEVGAGSTSMGSTGIVLESVTLELAAMSLGSGLMELMNTVGLRLTLMKLTSGGLSKVRVGSTRTALMGMAAARVTWTGSTATSSGSGL